MPNWVTTLFSVATWRSSRISAIECASGFLAIDMFATFHGCLGNHRMCMIGCRHHHGVQLAVVHVEQLAIVTILLGIAIGGKRVRRARSRSTSHMATLFSFCSASRLARPRPPTPTKPIFSFSLGGVWLLPATAQRGTIEKPATAAERFRKSRRFMTGNPFSVAVRVARRNATWPAPKHDAYKVKPRWSAWSVFTAGIRCYDQVLGWVFKLPDAEYRVNYAAAKELAEDELTTCIARHMLANGVVTAAAPYV